MVCSLVRDWKIVNTEVLQKEEKKNFTRLLHFSMFSNSLYSATFRKEKHMNLEGQLPNLWFCYGLCEIELQIPALCHAALAMCSVVHGGVVARYVVGVSHVLRKWTFGFSLAFPCKEKKKNTPSLLILLEE